MTDFDKLKKMVISRNKQNKKETLVITIGIFLSGVTGLVYEVVWSRELRLVLGSNMEAITLILIIFMSGLALGSYLIGRMADRIVNPLKIYVLLEAMIGLYGILSAFLFQPLNSLYIYLIRTGANPVALFTGRFLSSTIMLIFPTILMGGTLPVIARFWIKKETEIGKGVSYLYGINTLGAVIGAYFAGFVLLPSIGMRYSLCAVGATNIFIAITVWGLLVQDQKITENKSTLEKEIKRNHTTKLKAQPRQAISALQSFIMIFGVGMSGFSAMALEVAWTRILIQTIGSSVYAFSTILVCYLTGIAVGSLFVSRFFSSIRNTLRLFGIFQTLIFFSVIIITPILGNLPIIFLRIMGESFKDFSYVVTMNFFIILLITFIPTFLFGIIFPLAISILSEALSSIGRKIGNIYAVNTLGTIFGAGIAGFFLIPWLGTRTTVIISGSLNLFVGVSILLSIYPKKWKYLVILFLFSSIIVTGIPDWDKRLMIIGPYVYADSLEEYMRNQIFDDYIQNIKLKFYHEGMDATVAIIENKEGDRFLRINGKVDGSTRIEDMNTQLMLGHLPLILNHTAKQICVIGLGTGITCEAALTHPIGTVDCIEISKDVVEGCRQTLSDFNGNIFKDPRFHIIVTDARQYFNVVNKSYDVIISEPSNPWITGVSNMFTSECFWQFKTRLAPDGVVCQWIHYYSMELNDLKMVLRTFSEVFPHVSVWSYFPGDLLLTGSTKPLSIDYDNLVSILGDKKIVKSLDKANMSSIINLISGFLMNSEQIHEYTKNARINTDDRPILEFSAPRALFRYTALDNIMDIASHYPMALPSVSNISRDTPEGTVYKHMKLIADLSHGWKENWAGFWIGRTIKHGSTSKELAKDIAMSMGLRADFEKQDQHLIIEIAQRSQMGIEELKLSLLTKYKDHIQDKGEIDVRTHKGYWIYAKYPDMNYLEWSWFCPVNKLQYSSRLESKTPSSELMEELHSLTHEFHCYHN